MEHQKAAIKLRSGVVLEGELRWAGPAGRQRTADHMNNNEASYVLLHAGAINYFVVKVHIATVDER